MGNPWAYDFSAIGRRGPPLLVVLGSDSDAKANTAGGFHLGGNSDVHQLLPEDCAFDQVNLSRQFLKQQGRPDPAQYECVLNLITDPDQHPKSLETLRKMLRGYRGRVINRPEAVLRSSRDQVARRLTGIDGLVVPKVLRLRNPRPGEAAAMLGRAGLSFPAIARRAGTQTGESVSLVATAEELDAACCGAGEFILTEFVDFASGDSLYRKYRLWSFGKQTIFKHMIVSDQWSIHNKDRARTMGDRPDLVEEEEALFLAADGNLPSAVHPVFDAVRSRLGLDFFGMDFGIGQDGRVILFEANATMSFQMNFKPPFDYLEKANEPARQAFREMLFPAR